MSARGFRVRGGIEDAFQVPCARADSSRGRARAEVWTCVDLCDMAKPTEARPYARLVESENDVGTINHNRSLDQVRLFRSSIDGFRPGRGRPGP